MSCHGKQGDADAASQFVARASDLVSYSRNVTATWAFPKMRWVCCLWAHMAAAVEHIGRKYKPPRIKTSAELRYWSQHGYHLESTIISVVTHLKMSFLLTNSVRSISTSVLWAAWLLMLLCLTRWMCFKSRWTTILRLRSYTEQLS